MKIGFGTKIDEVEENDNEAIAMLVEHQGLKTRLVL